MTDKKKLLKCNYLRVFAPPTRAPRLWLKYHTTAGFPLNSPPLMTDMNSYEENEMQYECNKMQFIARILHVICVR